MISVQQIDKYGHYKATFSVERSWKSVKSTTVEISYDDLNANGCPFTLSVGIRYLFFASKTRDELLVGVCDERSAYEKYLGKSLKLKASPKSQ